MRNQDYNKQKLFFERFIENSDLKDFNKMKKLSDYNNYYYPESPKKKFNVKNLFHSYEFEHPSYEIIYKSIKNNSNIPDNNDYLKENDIQKSYTPNEINNYKLDIRNVFYDPEYKSKCLKVNNNWVNIKYNMLKCNMAKRRGVPFNDLKMNKIDKNVKKKNTMEINGGMIINSGFNPPRYDYYNKKIKNDSMNRNSDYIKRKYSGKLNNKNELLYNNNDYFIFSN